MTVLPIVLASAFLFTLGKLGPCETEPRGCVNPRVPHGNIPLPSQWSLSWIRAAVAARSLGMAGAGWLWLAMDGAGWGWLG